MAEFRTVQYQGADTKAQGYVGVPDGSAALESSANYQKGQLQRAGEALLNQNNQIARNQERVDQITLENARLSAAQLSSRNEVALRASQMVGEQKLNNLKMAEDNQLEIQKLQLTHQMQRDEFDLRNKQQQTEALTQFGQQMIQFSTTLWKAKAEDINRKNEELKSFGMMDRLMGIGVEPGDVERVEQSQRTRLAKQGEALQLANALEKAGLPNDAARVRASNPWYLHGRQEMSIIMGSSEMPDHLRKSVQEAEKAGLLVKGDPDYDVKLRAVVYDSMRNFMVQTGIVNMNPTLVAKYLQNGFLQSMASITKEFNAVNNQHVKQATEANALGDAINSSHLWAADTNELDKSVSQVMMNGGVPALGKLLESAMKRAELTEDDSAVRALMSHPAMQGFQGDYDAFETRRRARADAAMEKATKERTDALIAQFEIDARRNPDNMPALLAQIETHRGSLPVEEFNRLEKAAFSFNPQDQSHIAARLNHIVEHGNANEIAEFVRNNPTLGQSQKEKAQKAIEGRNKVANDPVIKMQIDQAVNLISGPNNLPAKVKAQAAINPFYKAQIEKIIKQREDALRYGAANYWSQPGATRDGFQQWVKDQQHLINKEITLDELGYSAKPPQQTKAVTPAAAVPYNGYQVVWLTEPNTQRAVLDGKYGNDIKPWKTVVMTKDQVIAWTNAYESTGVYPRELLTLAVRTRSKPQDLLRVQAQIHKLRGQVVHPSSPGSGPAAPAPSAPGQPVSRVYAQQAALSAGLSARGSIWFATNLFSESSGNPTAVHDGGEGYGLFGHQGSRLAELRQFTTARGVDISDGRTQIEFALQELKTKYRAAWDIVTAPNPTLNDLHRASKIYFGFGSANPAEDARINSIRYNNLKQSLGE